MESPKPLSRSSSKASHLSLDLSNVPALIQPSPPSNTLLITNLLNPEIFNPETLQEIRETIGNYANITAWAPLKSFRRIVAVFSSAEEAIAVREALDGENILGERVRVYFGEHTPENPGDQHLAAPESKKLFFISPPPSPPHGWELRNEDPPNNVVVAEDLAHALARLHCNRNNENWAKKSDGKDDNGNGSGSGNGNGKSTITGKGRSRSSSILLFEPEGNMPGISVDDYTETDVEDEVKDENVPLEIKGLPMPHTARPPVELMEH